jgi:hypothetical protein
LLEIAIFKAKRYALMIEGKIYKAYGSQRKASPLSSLPRLKKKKKERSGSCAGQKKGIIEKSLGSSLRHLQSYGSPRIARQIISRPRKKEEARQHVGIDAA